MKTLRSPFIYLGFSALGVIFLFHETLRSGFEITQADPMDTLLNNYFLEHAWQLVSNRDYRGGLFSAPFFFPHPRAIAFSENLLGVTPLYFILRLFFGVSLAYQLWMIAISVGNFITFSWVMRSLKVQTFWAAISAFLYAFSMPRAAQIGHQQLMGSFFAPLAFLLCYRFICSPTHTRFAWLLALVFLQLLSGIYLGWFLVFILAIFALVTLWQTGQASAVFAYLNQQRRLVCTMVAMFMGSCLALLGPYLLAKQEIGPRSYEEISIMLPRLGSWLFPVDSSLWWPWLGEPLLDQLPAPHEQKLFLGLGAFFLLGICLYSLSVNLPQRLLRPEIPPANLTQRKTLARSGLITFLLVFCVSLSWPNGWSLWQVSYGILPGASAIRVMARIWTVAYIPLLLAIFLMVDAINWRLFRRLGTLKRWSTFVALNFLIGFLLMEQLAFNLPAFNRSIQAGLVEEATNLMAGENCDVAYLSWDANAPMDWGLTHPVMPAMDHAEAQPPVHGFVAWQVLGMWVGLTANLPVVNGYSGGLPVGYGDSTAPMGLHRLVAWLDASREGNLCIVGAKEQPLLTAEAIALGLQQTAQGQHFDLYQLALPIAPQFSQEIVVSSDEMDRLATLTRNSQTNVLVTFKNTSNFWWSSQLESPVKLSYRWRDARGEILADEPERTPLLRPLSPGESDRALVNLKAPPRPGAYRLQFTMLQEGVAWFLDQGAPSPELPIEILYDELTEVGTAEVGTAETGSAET